MSSLPLRHALHPEEQHAFQEALHTHALAIASPFLPPRPSVFDTWQRLAHTQPDAFHHWQEEFVTYLPTHLSLAELEARLAVHQQSLQLDFPSHWNLAQVFAYAPPLPSDAWQMPLRQRVLGVHWLDAHGQVISSGGRVLKNVTGYDLHRLHLGFHGTLGIPIGLCLRTSAISRFTKQFFQWDSNEASFESLKKRLQKLTPKALQGLQYAEGKAYLTWQGSHDLLKDCFANILLEACETPFSASMDPLWEEGNPPLWQAQIPEALWQEWRTLRRAWEISPEQLQSPYFEENVYHA